MASAGRPRAARRARPRRTVPRSAALGSTRTEHCGARRRATSSRPTPRPWPAARTPRRPRSSSAFAVSPRAPPCRGPATTDAPYAGRVRSSRARSSSPAGAPLYDARMLEYTWRGPFDSDEVERLHAACFGREPSAWDWAGQVGKHSLGWVCARDGGALVGWVNVAWDGAGHAFVLVTIVPETHRRRGIATQLVATATTGA